ncbi:MAG: hypothetical protein ACLU4N_01280 [Butyricimonas faecihominis]
MLCAIFSLYAYGGNDYNLGKTGTNVGSASFKELYDLMMRMIFVGRFKEIDGKVYVTKWQCTDEHDINDVHSFPFSDLLLIEAEALARQVKTGFGFVV